MPDCEADEEENPKDKGHAGYYLPTPTGNPRRYDYGPQNYAVNESGNDSADNQLVCRALWSRSAFPGSCHLKP